MLKFFERLPLAIVFGALCAGLVLLTPVLSIPMFHQKLAALDAPPLEGIDIKWREPEKSVPLAIRESGASLASVMDGSFQKGMEYLVEAVFPFRAAIVRATNQVYYSLFARSYMYNNWIVIGKRQYLYEIGYINHQCNMQREKHTQKEFDQWAKSIEELSDLFARRGQTFLFVLTPSKAAYFPEYIPDKFGCSEQSPRPEYFLATAALQRTHVPFVDLSKLVIDAKDKYPLQLFNRGSTHWTMLAVTLSAREIAARISAQGKWRLPEVRFSYSVDNHPSGNDTDLLDLLNLWSPNRNYPVARVSFERQPPRTPAPRIAIVSGSFLRQMFYALRDTNMFESIDYYFYMGIEHIRHPALSGPPLKPDTAEYYRELLAADIVILEENAGNLGAPHVGMLEDVMAKYAGHTAVAK